MASEVVRQSLGRDRPGLSAAGSARRRVALAAIQRRLDRRIDEALDIAGADGWTGMLLRIEAARRAAPDAAIVLCEEVRTQAGRNGDHVVVVIAAMVRLDALRMDHRTAQLPAAAFELEQLLGHCRSTLLYPPEVWLACALANEACAQHALAARNLAQALEWIRRVALPQVPPEFADGFLQRNPVNVQLRALDARR